MMRTLIRAIAISFAFLILCGIIYPLGMTGISQLLFNKQANGSIIEYNGKPIGSELLGQAFSDERYFHGRVSAVNYNTYKEEDTKPDNGGKTGYTGVSSGSANLAPSNPALVERVKKDIEEFLNAHPGISKEDIPADLLTSTGSGLDPHISPESAEIQINAVSKATGISAEELNRLVKKYTEGRTFGIFGEPRVNILKVNLEIASLLCFNTKELGNSHIEDNKVYTIARAFAEGASVMDVRESLLKCIDFDEEDANEILFLVQDYNIDKDGRYSAFIKAVNKVLREDVYRVSCF